MSQRPFRLPAPFWIASQSHRVIRSRTGIDFWLPEQAWAMVDCYASAFDVPGNETFGATDERRSLLAAMAVLGWSERPAS